MAEGNVLYTHTFLGGYFPVIMLHCVQFKLKDAFFYK